MVQIKAWQGWEVCSLVWEVCNLVWEEEIHLRQICNQVWECKISLRLRINSWEEAILLQQIWWWFQTILSLTRTNPTTWILIRINKIKAMIHLAQMEKVLQKLDGKEMLMILDSITWALMLRKKRKTIYKNSRIFSHWEQIHSRQIRTITRAKLIWPITLDSLWASLKNYLSKHHPSNNNHLNNNHLNNNSNHHLISVNLLSQKKWLNL